MSHLASGLSYMVGGISPLRGVGIAARAVLWRPVQPLGTPAFRHETRRAEILGEEPERATAPTN